LELCFPAVTASPRGPAVTPDALLVAERVRAALVRTALAAYEDAALRGLCAEGAWEVAVTAVRQLDLSEALSAPPADSGR
jgi:hypothetical protein